MTGKQLTVQNASVTTMTVAVKTLMIGARQVTQGIFKQLIEEPLIAKDGTLNGVPWGHVTWHPDKCDDDDDHLHVVWQKQEDLRRASVELNPRFYWIVSAEIDRWAEADILNDLRKGRKVELHDSLSRKPLRPTDNPRSLKDLSPERLIEWEGVSVGYTLTDEAHRAALAWFQAARIDSAARKAQFQKAMAALEVSVGDVDLGELRRRALKVVRAEAERRQRHRDVRATLAQLPQLFIGG